MTDWRALCEELAGWIERSTRHYIQDPDVLIRARAALAQPGPDVAGPTVMEIIKLADEIEAAELGQVDFARAVLARWGLPAPVPAEGEVAELVAWLRMQGLAQKPGPNSLLSDRTKKELHAVGVKLTRAANLLELLSNWVPTDECLPPTPIPVSERLPGPEDCDAEGRCWWWRTDDADEWWELLCISDAREYNAGCGNARYTHWLPATALPLPQGEVQL